MRKWSENWVVATVVIVWKESIYLPFVFYPGSAKGKTGREMRKWWGVIQRFYRIHILLTSSPLLKNGSPWEKLTISWNYESKDKSFCSCVFYFPSPLLELICFLSIRTLYNFTISVFLIIAFHKISGNSVLYTSYGVLWDKNLNSSGWKRVKYHQYWIPSFTFLSFFTDTYTASKHVLIKTSKRGKHDLNPWTEQQSWSYIAAID